MRIRKVEGRRAVRRCAWGRRDSTAQLRRDRLLHAAASLWPPALWLPRDSSTKGIDMALGRLGAGLHCPASPPTPPRSPADSANDRRTWAGIGVGGMVAQVAALDRPDVILGVLRAQAGKMAEENHFRSHVTGSVRLSFTPRPGTRALVVTGCKCDYRPRTSLRACSRSAAEPPDLDDGRSSPVTACKSRICNP